ncbi:MAG TPA: SpoIIE family protein phosphatase [Turneriella sp.]|nr:SpoIIE family protein phosphatase [Turneriella sp.]
MRRFTQKSLSNYLKILYPHLLIIFQWCMRKCGFIFLFLLIPLSAKNLLREDMFVRQGFTHQWLTQWPERTKAIGDWKHIAATTSDNRPLRIGTLGAPFPKPGIYHWPTKTIHEYTAITRFFLLPNELKAPHAWGIRLGSIGDNWQIYLNGALIRQAWHIDAENKRITTHRMIRDAVVEIPQHLLVAGENLLAFRLAGDAESAEVGFFTGQPYEVDSLRTLLYERGETIILILLSLYLAVGFYHLLLYSRRRKENYNLYFGLFCLGLFLYLMTRTSIIFDYVQDSTLVQKIEFVVLFNMVSAFLFFVDTLFTRRISRFPKIYAIIAVILSLATIFTSALFNTTILRVWQLIALVGVLYFVVFQLMRTVIREVRTRIKSSTQKSAVLRLLLSLKDALLFSPSGNLFLGILTTMATAVFDILDSMFFATGIALSKYGFAIFVLGIAVMLANRFLKVHNEVEELNATLEKKVKERTHELQESLERVSALKQQQDADYFLTALLLKPLATSTAQSKNIQMEYLVKQKKTFEFRRWKSEIGGDINMAASISLKERPYVVFVNADAMGKSIQGAGGVLVLGSIIRAIIERTRISPVERQYFPERWLRNVVSEIQLVFESFNGSMYVSTVMGLLDEVSGCFYYINAEHPAPTLYRAGETRFIDPEGTYRKLGVPGLSETVRVKVFRLKPNDVVILGSDGKDDLLLETGDAMKRVNEDESLFLKIVMKTKGQLNEIVKQIETTGEVMDDLSLMRISYHAQETQPNRKELSEKVQKQVSECNAEKNYAKAAEELLSYITHFPDDSKAILLLVKMYRRMGKYDAAIDWAERLRLRAETNLPALQLLTDLYAYTGNLARAKQILRECSLIDAGNPKTEALREALEKKGEAA